MTPIPIEFRGIRCYRISPYLIVPSVGSVLNKIYPNTCREFYLERGCIYHEWMKSYLLADPMFKPILREKADPRILKAYDWIDNNIQDVVSVETPAYCKDYGFAGTIDVTAILKNGSRVILDWKFTDKVLPRYKMQMEVYSKFEFPFYDDYKLTAKPVLVLIPEKKEIRTLSCEPAPNLWAKFLNARSDIEEEWNRYEGDSGEACENYGSGPQDRENGRQYGSGV